MGVRLGIPAAALCLLGITSAHAFDCGKAATVVEKEICATGGLLELDGKLNAAYAVVKSLSTRDEQAMLSRSQKRWIAARENCPQAPEGISACIGNALNERLGILAGQPESGPGGSRMIPVFAVQDGSETAYDIDVALYRFADPRTPGETSFNRIVADDIGKLRFGKHGEDTMGRIYGVAESMTLSYVSPRLLSVRESYWSDEGGAHGNSMTENHNIDMQTGKVLEAGDIFPEAAVAKLASGCKLQIIAEKKERLESEYDPSADEFLKDDIIGEHMATLSRWSFSAGEASVSFDPYGIGSYAEGGYDCVFPMSQIKAMAREAALLPQ